MCACVQLKIGEKAVFTCIVLLGRLNKHLAKWVLIPNDSVVCRCELTASIVNYVSWPEKSSLQMVIFFQNYLETFYNYS